MSNNFQNSVTNASCLLDTNNFCYPDGPIIDIASYCNKGMNMLTEDICYDWYAHSVYDSNSSTGYYDSSAATLAFNKACDKYPWHDQCACKTVIDKFSSNSFSLTADPSKVYNVSCLYPACSKNNARSFTTMKPYIPYDIVHDDTISCPTTICTNIVKDSTINMNNSVFKLENICGLQDTVNTSNDADIDTNVVTTTFFQNNKVLIITGCIIFILLLLIIIITRSSSDNDNMMKIIMMKKMMNKRK